MRVWKCPFYHRVIGRDECYDLFPIAARAVRDADLIKEEGRDALGLMCEKCGSYRK